MAFKSKTDLILSIVDEFGIRFLLELDQLVNPEQEAQQKLLQFYLLCCKEFLEILNAMKNILRLLRLKLGNISLAQVITKKRR